MSLIITARNVTPEGLTNGDGKAHYEIWVGVNERKIWSGYVCDHVRDEGAAKLLRRIADEMDSVRNVARANAEEGEQR